METRIQLTAKEALKLQYATTIIRVYSGLEKSADVRELFYITYHTLLDLCSHYYYKKSEPFPINHNTELYIQELLELFTKAFDDNFTSLIIDTDEYQKKHSDEIYPHLSNYLRPDLLFLIITLKGLLDKIGLTRQNATL